MAITNIYIEPAFIPFEITHMNIVPHACISNRVHIHWSYIFIHRNKYIYIEIKHIYIHRTKCTYAEITHI